MKFIRPFILTNLLLAITTHAQDNEIKLMGQETGNGGDIVYCKDNLEQNKILDVYEAEDLYEWDLSHFDNVKNLEIAELIFLKRLDKVYPELTTILHEEFILFRKESKYPMNIQMRNIPDSKHPGVPEGCELKQIAYQRTPNVQGIPRYIISKSLYDTLDIKNKFALMLHEVLYKMAINKKEFHQDSTKVRDLTATLLSAQLSDLSYLSLVKLLSDLKISHPDLTFKFKGFSLYHNSMILSPLEGRAIQEAVVFSAPKVEFTLLGNHYSFLPEKVSFYSNGLVKSYLVDGKSNSLKINGRIDLAYDGEASYVTQIRGVTGMISFGEQNFLFFDDVGGRVRLHEDATGNLYAFGVSDNSVFYHSKYGRIPLEARAEFDHNYQLTFTFMNTEVESKVFQLNQNVFCEAGPISFLLLTYDLHSCILARDHELKDAEGKVYLFKATDEAEFGYDGYVNGEAAPEKGKNVTINSKN